MVFLDLANTNGSNPIIYFLFIILFIVIIAILLLLYLQNKEMRDSLSVNIDEDENNSMIEEIEENDNDTQEEVKNLQDLSRELEQLPKEHNIDMTQYEMDQEKTAIISYEELVNQAKGEDVGQSKDEIIGEIKTSNYQHEEEFLYNLKQLKKSLN